MGIVSVLARVIFAAHRPSPLSPPPRLGRASAMPVTSPPGVATAEVCQMMSPPSIASVIFQRLAENYGRDDAAAALRPARYQEITRASSLPAASGTRAGPLTALIEFQVIAPGYAGASRDFSSQEYYNAMFLLEPVIGVARQSSWAGLVLCREDI